MSVSRLLNSVWLYPALCLATFLFGGLFQPGDWYESLNRAPWSPPNIAFPIAWTILYVMIAWAGVLAAKSGDRLLLKLWFAQLIFNAAWSWLFFGEQWLTVALIDLLLVLALVLAFILRSLSLRQQLPALLFLPYLAWLALASSLNVYIVIYN